MRREHRKKLPEENSKIWPMSCHIGGAMAFRQNGGGKQTSVVLRPIDRLMLALIGIGVIFAALGLGEAVYRFLFLDFDGATDRLPVEMLFGLGFAWMATNLVKRIYRYRMKTSARIKLIRDRNHKIRRAAEAMVPVLHPSYQQAVRVIREEVDRIEWAVADILPR